MARGFLENSRSYGVVVATVAAGVDGTAVTVELPPVALKYHQTPSKTTTITTIQMTTPFELLFSCIECVKLFSNKEACLL